MSGPFDLPVSTTGGQAPGPVVRRGSPGPGVDQRWTPGVRPRVLDGIVIPAVSAVESAGRAVYTPASQVKTASTTARGVGFYSTAGQWVLVWCGDDTGERDAALTALLDDLARYTHRR